MCIDFLYIYLMSDLDVIAKLSYTLNFEWKVMEIHFKKLLGKM